MRQKLQNKTEICASHHQKAGVSYLPWLVFIRLQQLGPDLYHTHKTGRRQPTGSKINQHWLYFLFVYRGNVNGKTMIVWATKPLFIPVTKQVILALISACVSTKQYGHLRLNNYIISENTKIPAKRSIPYISVDLNHFYVL